jgi:hypothetical protein
MYNCPFCYYSDIRKSSLKRHLSIKTKCNKEIDLELYTKAINYLNEHKHSFSKFPDEIINYKNYKIEIYNKNELSLDLICNYLDNNPDIKKEILKKYSIDKSNVINEISGDNSNIINDISSDNLILINGNNNSINNYTLVYNNFGEEKINHITEEILAELCKSPYTACAELFKLINFNKEHIENFTVKSFNDRNKFIYIRKDNEWQKENKNIVIEQIITKNNIILSNFMCQSGLKYFSNNSIEKIDNYFEVVSDENSGVYKRIAEKCLLNIINYSHTMQNNYNKYIEKNNILIPLPNLN